MKRRTFLETVAAGFAALGFGMKSPASVAKDALGITVSQETITLRFAEPETVSLYFDGEDWVPFKWSDGWPRSGMDVRPEDWSIPAPKAGKR